MGLPFARWHLYKLGFGCADAARMRPPEHPHSGGFTGVRGWTPHSAYEGEGQDASRRTGIRLRLMGRNNSTLFLGAVHRLCSRWSLVGKSGSATESVKISPSRSRKTIRRIVVEEEEEVPRPWPRCPWRQPALRRLRVYPPFPFPWGPCFCPFQRQSTRRASSLRRGRRIGTRCP